MVSKLQQMNENSAVQAVLGYKAELASALKSSFSPYFVVDIPCPVKRHSITAVFVVPKSIPEPDPDNDGVKLAERLLAWARREVQGAIHSSAEVC